MSTLVVEGWSMTTGGGGPKSEELACGGMKGGNVVLESGNVLVGGATAAGGATDGVGV